MLCEVALAQADFSTQITVSSDYILRGLSRTTNSASARLSADYHSQNWFAGAWISSVDYPGVGPREDFSSDYDTAIYLGTFGDLNSQWQWQGQALLHSFDGPDVNFNGLYREISLGLSYRQRFTTNLILTDHEHLDTGRAQYLEFSATKPLSNLMEVSASIGFARTKDNLGENYRYADAGLSRAFGSLSADLRVFLTEGRAGRLNLLSKNRVVLSISKHF